MMRQAVTRNALILGLFAIATAGTLALTNQATLERIECNRQAALASSLLEVMPPELAGNNLLEDWITVSDPLLGRGEHHIYRARLDGRPSGIVMEAVAADGYGGRINLLVGADMDGRITGVRVVPPHNETPGLGDKIELKKSDWIRSFDGKSLGNPEASGWAVRKDGGKFDSFTGATITPRAVVAQVHRALRYLDAQGDELFLREAEAANSESCDD